MADSAEEDLIQRVLDLLGCLDRAAFLRRVAAWHESLGFGVMATRPEKVSRWKRGVRPDRYTETAMAAMLGVPTDQVRALGWPHWLRVALDADQVLLTAPWTPAGALTALDHLGRPDTMDRRAALFTGGALAATTLANWAAASPATAVLTSGRPRVTDRSAALIDARLTALRQLDDEIGSAETYALARAELSSITTVLRTRSYSEAVARQLFATAAEASRICGWCAFDSGDTAVAERHYMAAARAAASAQDPVVTANLFAFWAMARYSDHDTSGALDYADEALRNARRTGSPRMIAMIHARTARAHAKSGDLRASRRAEAAAFTAYDNAGRPDDEPACVYWVSRAELHSWAANNASDLHDPRRALTHYAAVAAPRDETYDGDAYPRSRALRLSREADVHLSLRDVDVAVHTADQAVRAMGGVTSGRGTSVLTDLRTKLRAHQHLPEVREFLDRTV
ncbi:MULTISPECIES: transcriptional regulator [unclassified Streptomyces]|uniref:transcriptional regulator n=1 Tax=unclassified Streptomyces TaxID=2593676 RepID=UPI002E27B95E|nr:transcriptional regulator [Streptomyces sp. NBC_01429]